MSNGIYIPDETLNLKNLELLKSCGNLINPKTNQISGGRVAKRDWFIKNGYEDILNQILESTKELEGIEPLGRRIWAFYHLPIKYCEHCGKNPVKKASKTDWKQFCSHECSEQSKKRKDKISKTLKGFDPKIRDEITKKQKRSIVKNYINALNKVNDDKIDYIESDEEFINQWFSEIQKRNLGDGYSLKTDQQINVLTNKSELIEHYITQKKSATEIAKELKCCLSTVLNYIRRHELDVRTFNYTVSSEEIELVNFLRNDLKISNIQTSVRGKLDNKRLEIDIFLPDYSLGIEMNGIYWHSLSENNEKDNRLNHLEKSLSAKNNGIRLIQISDHQWHYQKPIVKSMITNILGITQNRIFARKCDIEIADTKSLKKEYNAFLDKNHIQGSTNASMHIGLRNGKELVAVMTFGKSRFNKNYEWELLRFCNLLNSHVIGGFSKLLSNFEKIKNPTSIISYADFQRSNGDVYEKNGFEFVRHSTPGYFWTDGNRIFKRYQTQKHKLKSLLGENKFDPELSESQNMFENHFKRYWDCGQLVYVKQF